ncbi:MAG: zinc ABC transporter substrate-binding protein [Kastovskya adunca ATA6-11-RM4]|nr:zinc ABC transporter substrate-binding protein [Kastovskya adunca ATA6-11-RM4]
MLKCLQVRNYSLWGSTVLALAVGLTGCGSGGETAGNQSATRQTASGEKPAVVASYSVLCDFTEQIAQDTVDLTCLVGADEDPHAYNATPGDRKAVETAQLVLYGGYDHEPAIINLVEAVQTNAPKVAVHEEAVSNPIVAQGHHDHEEDGHDEHEGEETASGQAGEAAAKGDEGTHPDPHVWHDVKNAVAMIETIENHLAEIQPDSADLYARNAEQLKGELQQLDSWVKAQVGTIPEGRRKLVTTHDALSYYAQAYGLELVGALQGVVADEQPTASRVRELVQEIEKANVPTIFAEVTTNDRVIGTVAREANVKVSERELYVDGLGAKGSEAGTYAGMISHNTCAIVDGLGGKCTPFEGQAAK